MSSFKKKILLAGMVAIFSFLTMIGATYAWFTIGLASAVGPIDMTIQTSTSLMIMMDDMSAGGYDYGDPTDKAYLDNPANYVTLLTNDAIKAEYLFDSIVFQPITTEDGASWIRQDLTTAASADPAVPGQYIEFSVWLLSQDKAVTVAVMNYEASAANVNPLQDAVVDCVRLGVTGDDGIGIFGQDKDYDYIYEDTLAAIDGGIETTLTALHSLYYGDLVANQSTDALEDATTILTLAADVPEKVTLRIWIEGWDDDCDNNALAAHFTLNFGFIVKEVIV